MFVPNYYDEEGDAVQVFEIDTLPKSYFVIYDDNSKCTWKENENDWEDTPITLPCPHCGAKIQQQERVECECGFTINAITEEMMLSILNKTNSSLVCSTIARNHQYENDAELFVWKIGDYYWLEIKTGGK